MSGPAVEEYLLLALRLGRHVDGLVDYYYGPAELRDQVAAEPLTPAETLAADASRLAGLVAGSGSSAWFREQVRGLETYARVLAGADLSYADEVEGCYGVRPELVPEETFAAAHEALASLLPGDGPLGERYQAWRRAQWVPRDALPTLFDAVLPVLRHETAMEIGLPQGESFTIELVEDEPWAAFNYYLGGLRSRIAVNTDLPYPAWFVLHLLAHEAYPGHHTEHAWKESLLVEAAGMLAESIGPVPTPQSVLSEGIAVLAQERVWTPAAVGAAERVLEDVGVRLDVEHTRAVLAVLEPLDLVQANAALHVHQHGMSHTDAASYLGRWGLRSDEHAAAGVRFITDPAWRAYATTYTEGARLCRAFVAAHPEDGFRRLLTEQVAVADLVELAAAPP